MSTVNHGATRGRRVWRILKWTGGILLLLAIVLLTLVVRGFGPANFGRIVLGVGKTYDTVPPQLPAQLPGTAVLIFSKTNGYRDDEQIPAANASLEKIAKEHGWSSYTTENAAVFNPTQLKRFKVVVWSSVSGDVLTPTQRDAFRHWLEQGGGFVGLHGAGGDPEYNWKWYVDSLIGAQFIGHTMGPQFQPATLSVEDRTHPATRHLGPTWRRVDEWYSFAASPRPKGYHVLISIDERTYHPEINFWPLVRHRSVAMGRDHPMVWTHCEGPGRVFYSALGHRASAYSEPAHVRMIAGAISWAAGLEGPACGTAARAPTN